MLCATRKHCVPVAHCLIPAASPPAAVTPTARAPTAIPPIARSRVPITRCIFPHRLFGRPLLIHPPALGADAPSGIDVLGPRILAVRAELGTPTRAAHPFAGHGHNHPHQRPDQRRQAQARERAEDTRPPGSHLHRRRVDIAGALASLVVVRPPPILLDDHTHRPAHCDLTSIVGLEQCQYTRPLVQEHRPSPQPRPAGPIDVFGFVWLIAY